MAQERTEITGTGPQNTQPVEEALPSLEPQISAEPANVLPQVNHTLFSVMGEAERRLAFLQSLTIDSNGVAHSLNEETGIRTHLAAVTLDTEKAASLVPLEKGEEGSLLLPIAPYRRFGFFLGHTSPTQEVSGAIRMGLYPATPLITETVSDEQNREVFLGLRGMKPDEIDEQRWAQEIGLVDRLGFDASLSRGFFAKYHRANRGSDQWQASPLVALPDDQLDLLSHHDPRKVRINEFQTLFYGVQAVNQFQSLLSGGADDYLSFRGGYRGGDMLSYNTRSMGMKGIGVGFGKAESVTGNTTGIKVNSLEGAFRVVAIPA